MERYVSFVKEWASDHGLTYMCSIGDPRLKADYAEFKKTGKKPKKSGRASKYQTKEEARLANIAKTAERKRMKKMIQAGTPATVVEAPPPPPPPPKPTGESALKVLTNPDLLKQIGSFNRPKPIEPALKALYDLARNEAFVRVQPSIIDGKRMLVINRQYRDDFVNKYGDEDQYATPTVLANIDWLRFKNSIIGDNAKPASKIKVFKDIEKKYDTDITMERPIGGKGVIDSVLEKRGNQMPPASRKYLQDNGSLTITSMRIERIPLGKLQTNLTAIVYIRELLTKFKKPDNIPQDDLFHLQMILTLSNGRRVMWAKEEVIRLSENIYRGDRMESRELGKTNIKLQDFVDKTAKYMGAKFAPYNAFDNNCQDFVMASLKANGLGTQADFDFVKQDTKDLFKDRQWLVDMLKGSTDLASVFNIFLEGKGVR